MIELELESQFEHMVDTFSQSIDIVPKLYRDQQAEKPATIRVVILFVTLYAVQVVWMQNKAHEEKQCRIDYHYAVKPETPLGTV